MTGRVRRVQRCNTLQRTPTTQEPSPLGRHGIRLAAAMGTELRNGVVPATRRRILLSFAGWGLVLSCVGACSGLLGIETVYSESGDAAVDGGHDATAPADGDSSPPTTDGPPADTVSTDTSPDEGSEADAPSSDAPSKDAGPCGGGCDGATCFEGVCGGDLIVEVGAGTGFGCALTKAGSVWCWGMDNNGQLGTTSEGSMCTSLIGGLNTVPCSWTPQEIPGLHDVIHIGTGDSACAIERDHSVWCWGWNNNGVLGHVPGTSGDINGGSIWFNDTPTVVGSDDGGVLAAKAISTFNFGSPCVVTTSGNVACWGDNTYGQLGDGSEGGYTSSPTVIPNFSDVVKVSVGTATACALKTDGSVWCWGFENVGLGHDPSSGAPFEDVPCTYGSETGFCQLKPTLVYQSDNTTPQFGSDADAGVLRASDIAVGNETACAIAGGDVWCWGGYDGWESGPTPHVFPTKLVPGARATGVSLSFSNAFAALEGGGAIAWGSDDFGAPGIGFLEADAGGSCYLCVPPTPVDIDGGVAQVAAGWELGLFLKSDGTVWASGLNDTARLGHQGGQDGDEFCTGYGGQMADCNSRPTRVEPLP
jgi:alpha-tubulin suppressor-like RCC1 family protein